MIIRLLKVATFIVLLEYQVIFWNGEYNVITGVSLAVMAFFCFLVNIRGFKHEKNMCRASRNSKIKVAGIALLYGGLVGLALAFGQDFGQRLVAILVLQTLALLISNTYPRLKGMILKTNTANEAYQPALVSSFTIPATLLFTMNYLIGGLIGHNIAYQFVLIISAILFYEILAGRDRIVPMLEKGNINITEMRHYLFHRWSKYLNFFLGIWFFMLLERHEIVTEVEQRMLLFLFLIIFTVHTYGMIKKLNPTYIFAILAGATLVVSLELMLRAMFMGQIPPYIVILIVFMLYDAGDMYIHYREFNDLSRELWSKKAAIYVLMAVFIAQLHIFEQNPRLDFAGVSASVVNGEDILEGAESSTKGIIEVEDVHNRSVTRR